MAKKTIKEFTNFRISCSSIHGSIKDIIEVFNSDVEEAEQLGYKNLEFVHIASEFEYESDEIQLHGERQETDEELKARMKRKVTSKKSAATRKKLKEKKERGLLEKLKKKYGE